MRDYITGAVQRTNRQFNRDVANLFRQKGFDRVLENVKHFGTLRLERRPGEDIGDIDVLVVDERSGTLLAVEVKDFEFARTPFELANELAKLLEGKKSAAGHHEERLAFMQSNLASVVSELGLQAPYTEWQVVGQIVTSSDLMAAHFPAAIASKKRLNILSFASLAEMEANQLTARNRSQGPKRGRGRRRRRH